MYIYTYRWTTKFMKIQQPLGLLSRSTFRDFSETLVCFAVWAPSVWNNFQHFHQWLSLWFFCLSPQGPNALVTYTILSGADDSFRIDPESGDLIATKKLDRERRSKYSLLVRADDGKQSSDMRLNITVKDVNDHSPKFSRLTYSFDIPEDMAPGEVT